MRTCVRFKRLQPGRNVREKSPAVLIREEEEEEEGGKQGEDEEQRVCVCRGGSERVAAFLWEGLVDGGKG